MTNYSVEIKELQAQPAVSARAAAPPEQIGATLERLLETVRSYVRRQGAQPEGPPFVRYHSAPPGHVGLEAGYALGQPLAGEGEVLATELPAGPAAVAWHQGSYAQLREAYRALGLWLKAQGRQQAGPPWERYWTDPAQVPDPAQWRTEIVWPIR